MPRKISKVAQRQQKQTLQNIGEVEQVDIFRAIDSDRSTFYPIIQKLEESLTDYQDVLLKNFLEFYIKLCGLEEFVPELEKIEDVKQFKLGQLLQKAEDAQIKNEKNQLIYEETARKLIDQTKEQQGFRKRLGEFFETLFSSKTLLPFECSSFLELTYLWFHDLMRCRVRIVRVACLELIDIVIKQMSSRIDQISKQHIQDETWDQSVQLLKFIEMTWSNILTFTVKDVHTPIQSKSIQMLFSLLTCLPRQLGVPQIYEQLALLFTNEKYECREEAVKGLSNLINEVQLSASENKDLVQICLHFFEMQQDRIIFPIFDQNESIQINAIKSLRKMAVHLEGGNQPLLRDVNVENLAKLLYRTNERVKYELASTLIEIDGEFKTSIQGYDSQSVLKLVHLCLRFQPQNLSLQKSSELFFAPFFTLHKGIRNPDNFISLMSDKNEDGKCLETLIYFYKSNIQLSRTFQENSTNYWWVSLEEGEIEQISRQHDIFSNTLLKHLKSLELQFENSNEGLVAHLSLLQQVDLGELSQSSNFELLQHILQSLKRIFEKSSNQPILKLITELLRSFSNIGLTAKSLQVVYETINDMKASLIHFVQNDGLTMLNIAKATYMVMFTNTLITEIFSEKQIFDLRDILRQNTDKQVSECILELFTFSVVTAFKMFIRQDTKMIQIRLKTVQDIFDELEFIRGLFFEEAFQVLVNQQESIKTYLLIITVLSYLNNNKVSSPKTINYILTENQGLLLYKVLHQNILRKLEMKQTISDENKPQEDQMNPNIRLNELTEDDICGLVETLDLFKTSIKSIDQYFGLPVLFNLLQNSFNVKYKDNVNPILTKIHSMFSYWFQLEFLEANKSTLVYWKIVLDLAGFVVQNLQNSCKLFFQDFGKFLVESYLTKNLNGKVTTSQKKEKFIMFCAEIIFTSFQSCENVQAVQFLNSFFYKGSKMLTKLNIDRAMIKKICAFFEAKRIEFEKKYELGSSEKKQLTNNIKQVQTSLRELSGISQADLERVMESGMKENQPPNSQIKDSEMPKNNQEVLQEEIDNLSEEEVTIVESNQSQQLGISDKKQSTKKSNQLDEVIPVKVVKKQKRIKK